MQLMDMVTAYPYENLDTKIYMKILKRLKLTDSDSSKPWNTLLIRLRRSLYGLKQFTLMWCNCLSEYLINQGYENNKLYPCMFIKKSHSGFVIIAVYVDELNLIGTLEELEKTALHLKSEFE